PNRLPGPARRHHRPEDHTMLTRRDFLQTGGAAVAGLALAPVAQAAEAKPPETLVKALYDSLPDAQKKAVCFDWDFKDPKRGLLRTYISNNWMITSQAIKSGFYSTEQQDLIRKIWEGLLNPDWVKSFDKQLKDDMDGWGVRQGIALFGKPGDG